MAQTLILPFLTICIYLFFIGICFCDGFKLHIARKLIWFLIFLFISIYVLKETGGFDLALILPIPTLLAILFCRYELRKARQHSHASCAP
jgi:hypothetical protein